MNDEPTQELSDEKQYITKPGVTAILERIDALDKKWDKRFSVIEDRLNRMDSRLDRIEAMSLEARADLRDLRDALKEHLPQLR